MTTDPRRGGRTPSDLTTVWALASGLTAAWGVSAAVSELPWQSVFAVFLAAGLLAASLALSAEAVASDRVDLWKAGRAGLLTGLLVVVVVGLGSSAGMAGVALVGLLLVTRPGLRQRARAAMDRRRALRPADPEEWRGERAASWSERAPDERDDAWDRTVPGSLATEPDSFAALPLGDAPLDTAPDWSPTLTVPTHLSDQDLCLAWESSSRALRRCTTTGERLEVVRVRQACLDELERRQPDAVRAWVLAGADPDSSPARYLAG